MPAIPPHHVIHEFEKFAAPQPTLLNVQLANVTAYYQDSVDLAQLAMQPKLTLASSGSPNSTTSPFYNLEQLEVVGDIVGINGDTNVKGMYISKNLVTDSYPTPAKATPNTTPVSAGQMISDTSIIGFRHDVFKILYPDPMAATPTNMEIGSITASGCSGKPMSPGQPSGITGGDWAITGGTGAFLGVTGQIGGESIPHAGIRACSIHEDPSQRQFNAASDWSPQPPPCFPGKTGLYVIPMIPRHIIEICHAASGIPVDHHHPAMAGDQLILYATGLGPVRDQNGNAWPIGQPFPTSPIVTVISPVTLTIPNTPVLTIAPMDALGLPTYDNGYSVQFKMPTPPGPLPGTTTIQITSAWIPSVEHKLHVAWTSSRTPLNGWRKESA